MCTWDAAHMQGNVCRFSFLFRCLTPVAVRRLSSDFGNAAEFFWLYNRIGHEQEIRAFIVRFPSTHTAKEWRGKGGLCQSGFWLDVPSAQQISSFPALELHKRVDNSGYYICPHLLRLILDFKGAPCRCPCEIVGWRDSSVSSQHCEQGSCFSNLIVSIGSTPGLARPPGPPPAYCPVYVLW